MSFDLFGWDDDSKSTISLIKDRTENGERERAKSALALALWEMKMTGRRGVDIPRDWQTREWTNPKPNFPIHTHCNNTFPVGDYR